MARSKQLCVPRALAVSMLAGSIAACTSPTEPSKPNLVGVWAGQYLVTACSGASDPRDCRNVFGLAPLPYGPFAMRLTVTDQQGTSANGTLAIEGPPHALTTRAFTGSIDAAGLLSFDISDDVVVCGTTAATAHLSWRAQVGPGGTMDGTFTDIVPFGPVFCSGDLGRTFPFTTENQIPGLVRQPR
jgi:hypothetical protein